jgi:chromosome partitioning protein
MPTHVLGIVASKGGGSKSTLASALAVRAASGGRQVILLDADPQGSLLRWWEHRGKPASPDVFESASSKRDVALARARGAHWVIVDAPPSNLDSLVLPIVGAVDFVLIPCRVSSFDLDAIEAVVDACQRRKTPFAFILTQVDPRWEKFTASAAKALQRRGDLLEPQMRHRLAYASAPTIGKTGPETSDSRQAAEARVEIEAIWQAICKRMGATP